MKKDIKVVVFDFDGTLFETNLNYKQMKAETYRFLINHYKLPPNLLSMADRISTMVKKTEEYLRCTNKNITAESILSEVDRILEKYEQEGINVETPKNGAFEVLHFLKDNGFKIGILTNTNRKVIEAILEKFKIKDFFDIIVTRNETKVLKPNPRGLILISQKLGIPPEKIVFIGDSIIDMQTAKAINAIGWGFSGGVSKDNELLKAGAERIIHNLMEIKKIIKSN